MDRQEDIIRTFDERAKEYDGWFDNNPVFGIELAALQDLSKYYLEPKLEIGVGTGRFAKELRIDFGIDPALGPLRIARDRGIKTVAGTGEYLPFSSRSMGSIFILFTLCFLADPSKVLAECSRILVPEGILIVGIIPEGSSWGEQLKNKAMQGNPFYRHARFRTVIDLLDLLYKNGYLVFSSRSTLYQHPSEQYNDQRLDFVHDEQAGFCVLAAKVKENRS